MDTNTVGEILLSEHQDLEILLAHSGEEGLLSLIAACISRGIDTERALLAKVQQIGGHYYDRDVSILLQWHSSPLAGPQLWERDSGKGFHLVKRKDA